MTTEWQSLSLHVPGPPVRPGDRPDFSQMQIPRAGEVRRPPVDVAASDIHDLAYSVVRVLNRQGEAVGPWVPALDVDALKLGLRAMMKTRAFDVRMMMAQRQGKTSFYMQCTGEEAIACGFQTALGTGDMNFPTYRQQGLLIAQDWPLVDLMNQIFSNQADRLRGRQLPVLYSAREAGFFSVSGNLGTQYVQAVGWAMASAIRGDTRVAAAGVPATLVRVRCPPFAPDSRGRPRTAASVVGAGGGRIYAREAGTNAPTSRARGRAGRWRTAGDGYGWRVALNGIGPFWPRPPLCEHDSLSAAGAMTIVPVTRLPDALHVPLMTALGLFLMTALGPFDVRAVKV